MFLKLFFFLINFLSIYGASFYLDEYLLKKNYERLGIQNEFSDKHKYKKNQIIVSFQPYYNFFKVNQHSYTFKEVPFYNKRGLVVTSKEGKFFKKVIEFYEKKFNNKNFKIIKNSLKKQNKTNPIARVDKLVNTTPSASQSSDKLPLKKIDKKENVPTTFVLDDESSYNSIEEKSKINTIFLDAGHGGKDSGAVFYGYQEKDLVLDLTLELYKILKKKAVGINIILTRSKDNYLSLEDRTHLANSNLKENDNGIFISLHLNIWLNPKIRGLEIYYLDDNDEIFNKRIQDLYLLENDPNKNSINYFKKIFSYFKAIQFQNESRYLAEKIIANTFLRIKEYPIFRGVKRQVFYVLKGTLMPSILLELGFISNREDLEFLLDKNKKSILLEAIALSILEYSKEFEKTEGFKESLFYPDYIYD